MSLETDLHRSKKPPVSINSHVNILSSVKVLFQIDQITYIELTHGSPNYPCILGTHTELGGGGGGGGGGAVTLIPDSKLSPF